MRKNRLCCAGEFHLPRENREGRKNQILTITQFCLVCIDMKEHEYFNMRELICIQIETLQVRKNAIDTKYWRH